MKYKICLILSSIFILLVGFQFTTTKVTAQSDIFNTSAKDSHQCIGKDKDKVTLNIGISPDLVNTLGHPSFIRATTPGSPEKRGRLDGSSNTSISYELRSGQKATIKLDAVKDNRGLFAFDETVISLTKEITGNNCTGGETSAEPEAPTQPQVVSPTTVEFNNAISAVASCAGTKAKIDFTYDRSKLLELFGANNTVKIQQIGAYFFNIADKTVTTIRTTTQQGGQGTVTYPDLEPKTNYTFYLKLSDGNKVSGNNTIPTPNCPSNTTTTPVSLNQDNACQGFTEKYLDKCEGLKKDCVSSYNSFPPQERDAAMASLTRCIIDARAAANIVTVAEVQNVKEQLGAAAYDVWVGGNCELVWQGFHKNTPLDVTNGARCENAVKTKGCQNLPPETETTYPKLVSCIQTAAENLFKPATGGSGGGSGGAPAAPIAPAITTSASQKTARRTEILNNWCAAYLGANTAKGDLCVTEAGTKCGDTNLSNETTFTNCVKAKGLEMQKGVSTTAPAQGAAPRPATPPAPAAPTGNFFAGVAVVNGYEKVEPLPANTTSVDVGARIWKTNDQSKACEITQVSLKVTKEGSSNPITITGSDGKAIDPNKATNCQSYKAVLTGPGNYKLTVVHLNAHPEISFQVGGPGSSTGTATLPNLFACTTELDGTSAKSISASIKKAVNVPADLMGYNRVEWFVKKGPPTAEIQQGRETKYDPVRSPAYSKGSSLITPTTFNNLEPDPRYYVLGVAYIDKDNKTMAIECNPPAGPISVTATTSKIKASSKLAKSQNNQQVLGETSDDSGGDNSINFAVSCEGVCQVVARANTGDELFNGQVTGVETIHFAVPNLDAIDSIEVTAIPISSGNESVSSQTISIPIRHYNQTVPTTPVTAPPKVQNIHLSKSPEGESLASPERIDLIATSDLPVENPEFINTKTGEKYVVDDQDKDLKCTDDPSQNCVYMTHLYGEFIKDGDYSIQFSSSETLNFKIESDVAKEAPAPVVEGEDVPTKVVLSKDDGSQAQVVYENGELKNADFDLAEGNNALKYEVYYNNSDTPSKDFHFIVERVPQGGPPSDGVEPTVVNQYPECGACGQDPNILYMTKQMSDGNYNCDQVIEACSDSGKTCSGQSCVGDNDPNGNLENPAPASNTCIDTEDQNKQYNLGDYVRRCKENTHCKYDVFQCGESDWNYNGEEEDCNRCPENAPVEQPAPAAEDGTPSCNASDDSSWEYKNRECFECNKARDVYYNNCSGEWKTGNEGQQFEGECADWCQ